MQSCIKQEMQNAHNSPENIEATKVRNFVGSRHGFRQHHLCTTDAVFNLSSG
jgi:hypothetical protein